MSKWKDFLKEKSKKTTKTTSVKKNIDKVQVKEDKLEETDEQIVQDNTLPIVTPATPSSDMKFIGAFKYVPNPNEYPVNTTYRNVNEGVVYIKKDILWEEYVRDGRKGDTPKVWPSGGGLGEKDVRSLITNQVSGRLFLLTSATSTSPSATQLDLKSFDSQFDFNIVGLKVEGPSTGTYSAQIRFYTYENSTFKLAATSVVTNTNNIDGSIFLSENKQWCADITVTSGIVPAPGITVKAVL